jgi:Protein of unknown function (DUF2971)
MEEATSQELVFPENLFRYRSLDRDYAWEEIDRAVGQKQVFLTSAVYVNDPFDFRPRYIDSKLKDVLDDLKKTHGHRRIFSRKHLSDITGFPVSRPHYQRVSQRPNVQSAKDEIRAAKKLIFDLPRKTKLACFSETHLSIPMWAHYANNHEGICIKYKVDLSTAKGQDESIPLPVNYCVDRPSLDTMDIRGFTDRTASDQANEHYRQKIHDVLFLSKAQDWKYEREWRVFESDDRQARYKTINTLTVDAIYFGLRSTQANKNKAKSEFGARISLFELKQSKNEFTFEPTRL